METTKENGGSFAVDLNENEEGGVLKPAHKSYIALKGAEVSGGQEAGKGHIYVTGNGRNVNRDAPVQPPPQEMMLDLAEKCLPGRLADSCEISGVCGDYRGLNGFTESPVQEAIMIGFEGAGGTEEEEGLGLAGIPAAPCPAVLRGSEETRRQILQHQAGKSGGETPDSDDTSPGEEATDGGAVTGCIRTSFHIGRVPCSGKYQQNCACTAAAPDMPNGGFERPGYGGPGMAYCKQTGVFSRLYDVDCEDVNVANGGLHIVNPARATCDWSDLSPKNNTHIHSGLNVWSKSECSGGLASLCPRKDTPAADELSHPPVPFEDPESSAKIPSPSPSPTTNSPVSELQTGDDDEAFSPPIRPQTLRTNPNLAVSLSCDATPLSPDEDGGFYFGDDVYEEDFRNTLEAGRRQSAPDKLPDLSDQTDSSDPKLLPKRFGIADFFTRSLFSRKSKEPKQLSHNAAGWRIFGKPAAREDDAAKDPASPSSSTEQVEQGKDSVMCLAPQHPPPAGRRKNLEFEPLSTTALILEDRPANLPAKSLEETQRHKMEYEEMVAGAKRRELKEAQKKKRQMKERHRQEDSISNAMVIWNNEILPHWDTMKGTRRVRELWWQGLPPSVRGRVWSLAIGNELNITPELYEIFLSRAKEKWRSYSETSSVNDNESDGGASLADRESSLDLIKLDISRTFPSLFIFQKGGPYHDLLHSVLGAYTCYRPDIGYVQGMSFIAAVLILNLEEAEAFITFANLLNKPCQMAFFRVDHELMLKYFAVFEVFFEENLPRLFNHFQTNNLTPDLYLIDWIFTLYSKSLPLDVACRVWDVFCRDGEESLFRTGLGILRLFEDVLLQMDFIHIAQFLTRLPEDLQSHTLFTSMANTHMISRNRRWAQVFSASMKDKETDKNTSPALRS
ncbi:TBC1 domain family member 12-like [Aulostomus maculatus]